MTSRIQVVADPKYRKLRGSDKAAALLLAMGKPLASQLLKHFDDAELRHISRSAASLGAVPIPVLEELVEEFAGQFSSGVDLEGTAEEVEQLLTGVLPPEQIAEIMSEVLGNSNQSIWQRLSTLPDAVLAAYLEQEHPQTIALILSRLSPMATAGVIGKFQRVLRNDLVGRMLKLRPVMESVLRVLEKRLHEDLLLTRPVNANHDSLIRLADILNRMDRPEMEDVLMTIEARDPEMAQQLRQKLFSFEDLVKLSPKARASLFEKVPADTVALALRDADQAIAEAVLTALAARTRRMVEAELSSGVEVRPSDIVKARRSVAEIVLDMVGRGEIDMNNEDAAGAA